MYDIKNFLTKGDCKLKKNSVRLAASINVGSSAVRMEIAQWDGKKVSQLEYLEQALLLGSEIAERGSVSFQTVLRLSEILRDYKRLTDEYGIRKVHVITSSCLWKADNMASIVDHLYINSGLEINVAENMENSRMILDTVLLSHLLKKSRNLLLNLGSSNVGIADCQGTQIEFLYNLNSGIQDAIQMLLGITEETEEYEQATREYWMEKLVPVSGIVEFSAIEGLHINGDYTALLRKIVDIPSDQAHGYAKISKEKFYTFYENHRNLSCFQMGTRYSLSPEEGAGIYAILSLTDCLFRMCPVGEASLSTVYLNNSMTFFALTPGARRAFTMRGETSAYMASLRLASYYRCARNHVMQVERICAALYQALSKAQRFSGKQYQFLRIAAILHEVGQFIYSTSAEQATMQLVRNMQIVGMNSFETRTVAQIILPEEEKVRDRGYDFFSQEEFLQIRKMHALLEMADALDFSKEQKVNRIKATVEEMLLRIIVWTKADFAVEQWRFQKEVELFRETFGMEVVLEIHYHRDRRS